MPSDLDDRRQARRAAIRAVQESGDWEEDSRISVVVNPVVQAAKSDPPPVKHAKLVVSVIAAVMGLLAAVQQWFSRK